MVNNIGCREGHASCRRAWEFVYSHDSWMVFLGLVEDLLNISKWFWFCPHLLFRLILMYFLLLEAVYPLLSSALTHPSDALPDTGAALHGQ